MDYDPETYKPGEMDVTDHHATFESFVRVCVMTTIAVIITLIFLILVAV